MWAERWYLNIWFLRFEGLKKEILEPCVQWMTVYWNVLRKSHSPELIDVNDLLKDDREIYFRDQNPELQTYSKNTMQLYVSMNILNKKVFATRR